MDMASLSASEPPQAMAGILWDAKEVAKRLQVPTSWVYRAARDGVLPSVVCGRYRRFDPRDLDRWIEEQKSGPA
jgi:excisionase family DNA binding protein